MAIHTSYSDARARLAELWDRASDDRETIIISRRGHEDMAMLPASELSSIMTTLHLFSTPANAKRLAAAMERSEASQPPYETVDLDELRRQVEAGTYGMEEA